MCAVAQQRADDKTGTCVLLPSSGLTIKTMCASKLVLKQHISVRGPHTVRLSTLADKETSHSSESDKQLTVATGGRNMRLGRTTAVRRNVITITYKFGRVSEIMDTNDYCVRPSTQHST
jgi:hypothetical protein